MERRRSRGRGGRVFILQGMTSWPTVHERDWDLHFQDVILHARIRSHSPGNGGASSGPRRSQIGWVQNLQRVASTAFGSLQKGQVLTSAGAGSLISIFETT